MNNVVAFVIGLAVGYAICALYAIWLDQQQAEDVIADALEGVDYDTNVCELCSAPLGQLEYWKIDIARKVIIELWENDANSQYQYDYVLRQLDQQQAEPTGKCRIGIEATCTDAHACGSWCMNYVAEQQAEVVCPKCVGAGAKHDHVEFVLCEKHQQQAEEECTCGGANARGECLCDQQQAEPCPECGEETYNGVKVVEVDCLFCTKCDWSKDKQEDENKIVRKKLKEFKLESGPHFYNSPYSIKEVWDMIMKWTNTEE